MFDFLNTGFPLKPPASEAMRCELRAVSSSLEIVVLVATIPSSLTSNASEIISSNCDWLRSGAIFNNNGFCFEKL